jgi:hypothetical protein
MGTNSLPMAPVAPARRFSFFVLISGFDVWSPVQAACSAFSGEVIWRSSTSRTALMPAVSLRREE